MSGNEIGKKWLWSGLAVAAMTAVPQVMAWQEPAPPIPPTPPAIEEMVQLASASGSSYLGVGVVEVDKERARTLNLKDEYGVEVSHMEEGGPAAKAGLKTGDVVLEYNGQRVEGTQQFIRMVRETPAGRNVKLLVSRNGATQNMLVTTGTRRMVVPEIGMLRSPNAPMPPLPPSFEGFDVQVPNGPQVFTMSRGAVLGVEIEPLSAQLAQFFGVKEGLLVRSVGSGSAAEKGGIKAGDVITRIDGAPVASTRDITSKLRSGSGARTAAVMVMRDKKELTLTVAIEEPRSSAPVGRSVTVRSSNRI